MESISPDPFFPQKRLRNLRGLAVRHLSLPMESERVFGVAFTLHSPCNEELSLPLFISEPVYNSANPTWEEMDNKLFSDARNTECVIQLFLLFEDDAAVCRKLMHLQFDFRLLIRIGESLDTVDYDFRQNTVIIALNCGVYVLPDSIPKDFRDIPPAPSRTTRRACRPGTLRQLLKLEHDFAAIQTRRRESHVLVTGILEESVQRRNVLRQTEHFTQRLRYLKSTFLTYQQENLAMSLSVTDLTVHNERLSDTLETNVLDLVLHKRSLIVAHEELRQSKAEFFRMRAGLRDRRCELVSDLKLIYPIHRSASGRVFISGIWLPSVDEYTNCDDTTLSASLGYAAHLLILLSRILDVPLRYPLKYFCSTSAVINQASARLPDRDREFPLHLKVRDRARFLEATYLLNCDIIQLRLNFGLGTRDVKNTIENIQSLMVEKFEVKPPRTPSIRIPPSPAPPDSSAQSSPFTPMVNNGHTGNGTEQEEGPVPPVTPAVIFPVQSAPDLSRLKTPGKPGNPFFIQNGYNTP